MTPAAIRGSAAPAEEKEEAIGTWTEAVDLANGFLASPFRRTLPEGRFDLDEAEGMRFVAADRTWSIEVRSTTGGDLVLWAGYQAQERSYGFVVGSCPPDEEPLLHHSLFRTKSGDLLDPDALARLVLHETTHVVFREGTIGFWNSLAYYLEAIFLFRSRTHSDEDLPRATSEEFLFYRLWPDGTPEWRAKALEMLEDHLGEDRPHCRHGPVPIED